jgi:hypothetical protein
VEEEQKQLAKAAMADHEAKHKKSKKKDEGIPKLDKVTIKRMKPAQMKEELKLRSLDIQGNAKVLLKRLSDFEEAR